MFIAHTGDLFVVLTLQQDLQAQIHAGSTSEGGYSRASEEVSWQIQDAIWPQEGHRDIVARLDKAKKSGVSFVLAIRCSISSVHSLLRPSGAFFFLGSIVNSSLPTLGFIHVWDRVVLGMGGLSGSKWICCNRRGRRFQDLFLRANVYFVTQLS